MPVDIYVVGGIAAAAAAAITDVVAAIGAPLVLS
jgi:hypothetical protein